MRKSIWPLAALLMLAGCGDKPDEAASENGPVSETVMDNVDDLHGTISDDMIAIDDIRSQAPVTGEENAAGEADVDAADGDVSADGSPPADSQADEEAAAE